MLNSQTDVRKTRSRSRGASEGPRGGSRSKSKVARKNRNVSKGRSALKDQGTSVIRDQSPRTRQKNRSVAPLKHSKSRSKNRSAEHKRNQKSKSSKAVNVGGVADPGQIIEVPKEEEHVSSEGDWSEKE